MRAQTNLFRIGKTRLLGYYLCVSMGIIFSFIQPLSAGPGVMSGSMEYVCDPPIYLEMNFTKAENKGTLAIRILASSTYKFKKHAGLYATAISCTLPDTCVHGKGSVVFDQTKLAKKGSGAYSIEFHDGHKEEGRFTVDRVPQKEPYVCY